MSTFVLIHGAGDTGWSWHLVQAEYRLGIVPDEIAGSHCVALSRPEQVADMLTAYTATATPLTIEQ